MRKIESMDEVLAEFLKPENPTALEKYWAYMLPKIPLPDVAQWFRWQRVFGNDETVLRHAIRCAARRRRPFSDAAHAYSYVSSVALTSWNAAEATRKQAA